MVIAGDGVPCAGLDEPVSRRHRTVHTVLRGDLVQALAGPGFRISSTTTRRWPTRPEDGEPATASQHPAAHPPGARPGARHRAGVDRTRRPPHFSGEILLAHDLLTIPV